MTPCEHRDGGYGKVLSALPKCDVCGLPMERLAPELEDMLVVLDAVIADPVGLNTVNVSWEAVETIASEQGHAETLRRIKTLSANDHLGPTFPWSVEAQRGGLFFRRR